VTRKPCTVHETGATPRRTSKRRSQALFVVLLRLGARLVTRPSTCAGGAGNRSSLWSGVEWCGYQIEGISVPMPDGRSRLLVVEGEAT
jgi:hypothetical protein